MARYGHRSTLVAVGAGELALAATIHLVENLLVIGLYDGIIRTMAASGGSDSAAGDALWAVASSASVLAFGVLGLGALTAGMGFLRDLGAPLRFGYWGVFTGLLGFAAASSWIFAGLSFLAGPFNLSMLAWLIVLGLRAARDEDPGRPQGGQDLWGTADHGRAQRRSAGGLPCHRRRNFGLSSAAVSEQNGWGADLFGPPGDAGADSLAGSALLSDRLAGAVTLCPLHTR